MAAHLHRLEAAHWQTEWKAAWWSVPVQLNALFFLLYALFVLAEQDCGPCNYVLCTAFLCTPILCVTTSLWNIREAAIAVESAQTVTIIRYYFALCHYYCDYFFDYTHYSTTKSRILSWNSLHRTGQSHHPWRKNSVRSIQQRRRLNPRPRRCLLPQQGRHRPHRPPLGTHDGCRKATRHAWQDETDRPGYQRIGQLTSSCPTTRGQQVPDLDEPAIIHIIGIISIIHIIRIIGLIGITFSAWVSVLNSIMSSIKWTIFLFNTNTFFTMSPCGE